MNNSAHISDEKLTEYALSSLPYGEQISMNAHFLLCDQCRESLRKKSIALAAYGATVPQVFVPIGARDRFFASLLNSAQTAQGAPTGKFKLPFSDVLGPRLRWLGNGRWVQVVAVILAVSLFYVSVNYFRVVNQYHIFNGQAREGEIESMRMHELLDLLTSPTAKRADLRQTPELTPPPMGHVMYSMEHGTLYFIGSNLKPLPVGRAYELWILTPNHGQPIAAGAFTPDNYGFANLVPATLPQQINVSGYGVTIEDQIGVTTPTLPYIISSLTEEQRGNQLSPYSQSIH